MESEDFDPQTLVGRTITGAELVDAPYETFLRVQLDDGRSLDIKGFTDVFTDNNDVSVEPTPA